MNNFSLPSDVIFITQFSVMMLVNILVAYWYVIPWLRRVSLKDALTPMLLLHVTRVVGLVFIVNAVTDPALPRGIAYMAAGGDFSAAMLSLLALVFVRKEIRGANVMIVIANIIGIADLLIVSIWGSLMPISFPNYQLGPAWFIPTFIGPTMMVSHGLMLWRVLVRAKHN
ncbi:MAG: hypothetical protein GX421_01700 [Caldisericales bacterium]|nr:hypothetical protein [Caldisericales bacterium]